MIKPKHGSSRKEWHAWRLACEAEIYQCRVCARKFEPWYDSENDSVCRFCFKTARAVHDLDDRLKTPASINRLQKTYGLSMLDYAKMVKRCKGRCTICQLERSLVVDHDHASGEVRGLLCHRCNLAIGLFQDSPEVAARASLYLRGVDLISGFDNRDKSLYTSSSSVESNGLTETG